MNYARGRFVRPGIRLVASGVIAASLAAPMFAQNTAGRVQLELSNTPLSSAIDLLTQRSGAKIVIADSAALSNKKVTVSLSGMTVDQALNAILTGSKTPWYKGDDGVFYINADAPVAPLAPEPPAPARIITTEKLELRSQSPSMMMRALGLDKTFPLEASGALGMQPWVPTPIGSGVQPAATMAQPIKTVEVNGRKWELWKGNAYSVPTSANVPVAVGSANGDASVTSSDQAERGIEELDSAGQVGFPRGRGRSGTTTTTGAQTGPGTLGGGANQAGGNQQNGQGGRLVPDGIDTIFPYEEDNSLLVRGEPDAIDELKNIIALLDVPVRQVSIKAEFVTVSDTDYDAFGLNWTTSVLNSNVATDIGGGGTGPTITIGIAQGNINATMTALRQRGRAHTLQAPLISTLNNVPATIQTSQQVPYFQPQVLQGGTGGGGNITNYTVQTINAQTGLQVTPRVNRDGSVTVQIHPQVSAFAGNVEGPNKQVVPILVTQELFTNRRVKSGESIILGGLATKNITHTSRGIPFLEDLPLVGRFFRANDDRLEDSQLLIFLTPTIISEDSGAQVSPS
ncbi:MAG TPA: secretin N-terminal domain-containing protein [Armatimonadota bacterium]|jgi:hypothetical protein